MSPHSDRDDIEKALLLRYLLGDHSLSSAQEERIRTRLQNDTGWRHLMHSAGSRPPVDWDTDAEWKRLEARVRDESNVEKQSTASRSGRRRFAASPLLRTAAILTGVALAALLLAQLWQGPSTGAVGPEEQVFVTRKGERAILQLTDGSHIRLNVDSRLRLAADFSSGRREVWLEGQAYFKVASDSGRPFVVHADLATVEVLGTAFDVSVYASEPEVRVVVADGKVAMASTYRAPEEKVVLTAHQMGRVSRSGPQVGRTTVDVERHVAWIDGELVFEDAPFDKVVRRLERWYDLDIDTGEAAAPSGHLNASFAQQQSMNEVLGIIATAFGLDYMRAGKVITFVYVQSTSS